MRRLPFKYQSGEAICEGDRVLFHGEPGEIVLVVAPGDEDEAKAWYVEEFGGGVGIREPKYFGSAFIPTDQINEARLEFVARGEGKIPFSKT